MNEKQNLHTHSLFCDGKNSLEEMVKEAITQDFTSIGFSSHAYTAFPFDECGIKSKEKESGRIRETCKDTLKKAPCTVVRI